MSTAPWRSAARCKGAGDGLGVRHVHHPRCSPRPGPRAPARWRPAAPHPDPRARPPRRCEQALGDGPSDPLGAAGHDGVASLQVDCVHPFAPVAGGVPPPPNPRGDGAADPCQWLQLRYPNTRGRFDEYLHGSSRRLGSRGRFRGNDVSSVFAVIPAKAGNGVNRNHVLSEASNSRGFEFRRTAYCRVTYIMLAYCQPDN